MEPQLQWDCSQFKNEIQKVLFDTKYLLVKNPIFTVPLESAFGFLKVLIIAASSNSPI